ncbi:hypothetical protein BOW53_03690 [Solemya pervernicosa gill symbiont]|uniref:ATP-grasp domain-containing protein n=2 Tax=Gammaproteobacteria incertae sedis TaxID=118884 RepID=A0A1T2L977_9GAMM|nr:hypothetical protein [Candidatus Reidiella endopervernicosa]OOZ41486.1 hypothetical protein BOW53_03690 [Solemya pervernicosa gill symbiont]QKQ27315.1 hypothetical protein HUE57_14245 [Candidatus Reidiella endopervernicosa]
MINFITATGHDYSVEALSEADGGFDLKTSSYDELFAKRSLTAGSYIFSDLERLMPWELRIASEVYHSLNKAEGCRPLNNPARAQSRVELLKGLHRLGVNDFDVYRADEYPAPRRFPVFVRWEGDHGKPLSDLLLTQADLENSLTQLRETGYPLRGLLVVEFCAEETSPSVYRKYGAFRVGDRIVAHHFVIEDNWNVKYGKIGLASDDDFRDEIAYVRENPHAEQLMKIFQQAGIEYGRADYGLVGGRMQVYEINTNPHIKVGVKHRSPLRREALAIGEKSLLDAFAEIDVMGQHKDKISLDSKLLCPYRPYKNLFKKRYLRRP